MRYRSMDGLLMMTREEVKTALGISVGSLQGLRHGEILTTESYMNDSYHWDSVRRYLVAKVERLETGLSECKANLLALDNEAEGLNVKWTQEENERLRLGAERRQRAREIARFKESGMSYAALARQYNCSVGVIKKRIEWAAWLDRRKVA